MKMTSDLPDKERFLMNIIRELCSTMLQKGLSFRDDWGIIGIPGKEYLHFKHLDYKDIRVGDLVLCQSSGIHAWTVGFVAEKFNPDWHGLRIREIGGERICNISNESYAVIVGLDEPNCWEGERYQFYCKVWKAFWKTGEDHTYRYGGMKFNDDGSATITVREKFGGYCGPDQESVPFDVTMKWSSKMSIKKIVQALKEGGVGTHKFERRPTGKPAENGKRMYIEM